VPPTKAEGRLGALAGELPYQFLILGVSLALEMWKCPAGALHRPFFLETAIKSFFEGCEKRAKLKIGGTRTT